MHRTTSSLCLKDSIFLFKSVLFACLMDVMWMKLDLYTIKNVTNGSSGKKIRSSLNPKTFEMLR